MKLFYEWMIPTIGFLVWIVVILVAVRSFVRHLKKRADRTHQAWQEILSSTIGAPLIFFLIGLGLNIFRDALPPIPLKWERYINASLILLFLIGTYLFVDQLMIQFLQRYSKKIEGSALPTWVAKSIYRVILLIFVFLIILDSLKITITPFVASLGIGGVVVGLALQDTLSNFFSWLYLLWNKPVRVGDYIQVDPGKEGYVERIGWRSLRIRQLSNNTLVVPNNKMISSHVINFYLPEKELAVLVNLGVSYQSDLEKVEKVTVEVAKQVMQETPGAVKEFEPFIRYNGFGESGITFTVILRGKEYTDQYLIIHEFIKRLHRRYQSEGIEIPFAVRTIYMKNEMVKNGLASGR